MIDDDLWNQWACDPDEPYNPKSECTKDHDNEGVVMACALFILLCVTCAYIYHDYSSSEAESESDSEGVPDTVYEQLDAYGGTVRIGDGSWYVPIESNVILKNGYLHIDQAKGSSTSSRSYDVYFPLEHITYIMINTH